jgi:3-hydroxyisobutyrate dehydrogenase
MATNCKNGGHNVKAYDVFPDARQRASEAGLTVVDSIEEACKDVDYVALSLPATKHVEEVLKKEGGVFDSAAKGTMIFDTSTISPIASAEFAKDAAKEGLIFMDTPMSGGTAGAKNATLCFMIGGKEENVEAAKAVLKPMGANFIHCGVAGMGETAKLTNNLILGINMVAAAEGFAIGEKLGMDPKTLTDVIAVSSARSFTFEVFHPRPDMVATSPSSRNYENGF